MEPAHIHSDIIFEILIRASSDALGRCRVASKEWNKLTYDSKFKKLRSQKMNVFYGFFIHDPFSRHYAYSFASLYDERITLDFIPGYDVRIQAVSTNKGIILCRSENFRQYKVPFFFVCKPQIKLFQQIPNPRTRFLTTGMAICIVHSNPFHYKILRISSSKTHVGDCQQLILEIFDSEAWKWKRLKDFLLPYNVWFLSERSITANGAFHLMLYSNLIFSFDIEKEEWKIINLPNEEEYRSVHMVEYEGKLALMCIDMENFMHTWVLESYLNLVWQKRFVVNMKKIESTYFPMVFYGFDILVLRGYSSLMYYDFKNEKVLKNVKLKRNDHPHYIFPFWSDSEPCRLKPAREIVYECLSRKMKKRKTEI